MSDTLETRSNVSDLAPLDDLTVEGYAVVFSQPSVFSGLASWDYEIIEPGAFVNCDMSNVVFRYNHSDADQLLARTSNNTLVLTIDDKGLHVKASLADTQQGRDLYKLIERRDVSAMSFSFVVGESYIEHRVRHVTAIKRLADVSAVDNPAYPATTIDVVQRSVDKLVADDKATRARIQILANTIA